MFEEQIQFTGRGGRRSPASISTPAIVRTLGHDLQLEERIVYSIDFNFDSRQVTDLIVNGVDQLTGNGIYLIASKTGQDITRTNYFSVKGQPGRMASAGDLNGPAYTLVFREAAPNKLSFRATVTANDNYATVSMPFDFGKQNVSHFAFNGSRYRLENSVPGGTRNGSGAAYNSIPTGGDPIRDDNGNIIGYVGVAVVDGAVRWGEVSGNLATIRVNINQSSHYTSLKFHNHPGTNNLELSFGRMRRGETAMVEGEIVVTPRQVFNFWMFQAETQLAHQIGRRDGDGWSVRVGDTPGRYLSYGPYTTAISPGSRTATFRLMVDNNTADNSRVLTIDVFDARTGRVVASRNITRREFTGAMRYQDFNLGFIATSGQQLEFRTFWHGGSYVRQDYVAVRG